MTTPSGSYLDGSYFLGGYQPNLPGMASVQQGLQGGFAANYLTGTPSPTVTPQSIMANGLFGGDGIGGNPGAIPAIWNKIGGMEGLNSGISAFGNLANIYMGFKSLGLANDQLDFAKSSFNKNFNAQAKSYNNELKDRWEARTAGAAARGRS